MEFKCPLNKEHIVDIESIDQSDNAVLITWKCTECSAVGTYITNVNESHEVYCMKKEDFNKMKTSTEDLLDEFLNQAEDFMLSEEKNKELKKELSILQNFTKDAIEDADRYKDEMLEEEEQNLKLMQKIEQMHALIKEANTIISNLYAGSSEYMKLGINNQLTSYWDRQGNIDE